MLGQPEQDCPLCGNDPNDSTLHADSCPTVTRDMCGVMTDKGICLRSDHMPEDVSNNVAWVKWNEEHAWTPLSEAKGLME